MPTSQYQITVSNFNGTTPCQSYSVYTGTTHDIDDADYVEDVNVPVSGYTLSLDIDSSYTGVYLFIEHCDGHINSVPSSTPKLQGGYQLVFVDLRCDDCIGERPPATPTPTITPTYSQTITPTYSQTITPTRTPTLTPTRTLTPTIEASATPTPTYSQTVTPTYSQTVTPTYSQTVTPTLTPMIEEGCYCYEFYIDEREFGDYGGPIVEYLDCSLTPQSVGFSGIGTFSGYCISSITNWYRFIGPGESDIAEIEFSTYTNTGNPCTVDGDCIVTGEPTPTPTRTPEVTPTLTVTPTYSQTVTPTRTPTLTPTYSQTVTPTYSQTVTPTVTQTITLTATPINEPTPTPTVVSETPCNCYTVQCTNPEGCELLPFENCNGEMMVGFAIAGSTTVSICGNIINLEQPNLIITNTGKECFFDGEIYTCLTCQCATIYIDERDLVASDDGKVYVDMIKCDGTETINQYTSPGTYVVCIQVINDIYILKLGTPSAPSYSTTNLLGGTCTVDNDCME
jgi:hypothetical protein